MALFYVFIRKFVIGKRFYQNMEMVSHNTNPYGIYDIFDGRKA